MSLLRNINFFSTAILAIGFLALSLENSSFAVSPTSPVSAKAAPCAVLEKFGGQVRLLDPTRTDAVEPSYHADIACDGWVAVDGNGWALIHHRDGFLIQLGSSSFLQIRDLKAASNLNRDHAVLYQGSVFGRAGAGSGELRVLTANSRARLMNGSFVVVYNQGEEETQLIGIEQKSTIENRFDGTQTMSIRAGEASSLGFHSGRTLPSVPRAVSIASMKDKLIDLGLPENDYRIAIGAVRERQEQKAFAQSEDVHPVVNSKAGRGIASTKKGTYVRHPVSKSDAFLKSHLVKRTVGDEAAGEKILFPDLSAPANRKVGISVEDVDGRRQGSGLRNLKTKDEDREKARLIEELSRVRPEL